VKGKRWNLDKLLGAPASDYSPQTRSFRSSGSNRSRLSFGTFCLCKKTEFPRLTTVCYGKSDTDARCLILNSICGMLNVDKAHNLNKLNERQ
jgi:hypothetical protein